MAVIVVIAIAAGIMLGVAGYVQRRVAVATARSELAVLETALEAYKSDWGFYPATTIARISGDGSKEALNNFLLYRALSGGCTKCTKQYLVFPAQEMRTNQITLLPTICDPWGTPFNYYNSPATTYGVSNAIPANWGSGNWYGGYACGGQVNLSSYDLFSYGPDQYTYVPAAVAYGYGGNGADYAWSYGPLGGGFTNPATAFDDITNWK
jgi:type II secretory pathway pseudopilin PulG